MLIEQMFEYHKEEREDLAVFSCYAYCRDYAKLANAVKSYNAVNAFHHVYLFDLEDNFMHLILVSINEFTSHWDVEFMFKIISTKIEACYKLGTFSNKEWTNS